MNMKRKFLEDLGLEKETIDKIMAENGNDINAEKAKVADIQSQLDKSNKIIEERDKQLEDLKKSTGDVEAMKNQIETLQNANKDALAKYQADIKELKVNNMIETELAKHGALNTRAVKALLDINMDNIKVKEDGSIEGLDLDTQLNTLMTAEDSKFMFKTPANNGNGGQPSGMTPAPTPNVNNPQGVDFNSMSYDQLTAYMAAHPDVKLD